MTPPPDPIRCARCSAHQSTPDTARAAGWSIRDWPTHTGATITAGVCGTCLTLPPPGRDPGPPTKELAL